MRVLHIVAERDGSEDSRAAAESLIASMADVDPGVEVAEVDLSAGARWGRRAQGGTPAPPEGSTASVLVELMAADVLVLSVPGTGEVPEGVRWLTQALRGPEARLMRAADRRGGHRVNRRLVVVATQGGSASARQLAGLLALVRDAFRGADVGEVGLITGERAATCAPGPPAGPIRSGARAWVSRGAPWTRAAAS